MEDPRFPAMAKDPKHCFNCKHGSLDPQDDKVYCKHPDRPHPKGSADRSEVIRWAVGCPQHTKETTPC